AHVIVYGLELSPGPRFAPSRMNWTPATPMLSVAAADTVTAEPETVAPFAGAVIDTEGGVVSGGGALLTMTVIAAAVAALLAASRATAVSVCAPLTAALVFHAIVYRPELSLAPRLLPSKI